MEEYGCLNHCAKGPNVELQYRGGKKKVVEGIRTFKKAASLIEEKAEVRVPRSVYDLAKIKYDIRREVDQDTRRSKLEKCFSALGGPTMAAQNEPRLFCELLVMRSREYLKDDMAKALDDAQRAQELATDWAQPKLALANCLEALSRSAEAIEVLREALQIEKGINKSQLRRQIMRLERKAKGPDGAPSPEASLTLGDASVSLAPATASLTPATASWTPATGSLTPATASLRPAMVALASDASSASMPRQMLVQKTVSSGSSQAAGATASLPLRPAAALPIPRTISEPTMPHPMAPAKSASAKPQAKATRSPMKLAPPLGVRQPPQVRRKGSSTFSSTLSDTAKTASSELRRYKPKDSATSSTNSALFASMMRQTSAQSSSSQGQSRRAKPSTRPSVDMSMTSLSSLSGEVEPEYDERRGLVEGTADFTPWKLESISKLNHDCLKMGLRSKKPKVTARHPPPGDVWHVDILKLERLGEELRRSYTPVSDAQAYKAGTLELMVKVYPHGKMTQHLASLGLGDTVLISPPRATFDLDHVSALVMVAGGSAVTVALQICKAMLKRHPKDVPVRLALCNHTMADVLYSDVLSNLCRQKQWLHVTHYISGGELPKRPTEADPAQFHAGRLSKEVLQDASSYAKLIVSGPPGLCQCAADLWVDSGKSQETLFILDELPEGVTQAPSQLDETQSVKDGSKDEGLTSTRDNQLSEDDSYSIAASEPASPRALPRRRSWCCWCRSSDDLHSMRAPKG